MRTDNKFSSRASARSHLGPEQTKEMDPNDVQRTPCGSMIEMFPLEKVAEDYERMASGKARFRVVLTTGQ